MTALASMPGVEPHNRLPIAGEALTAGDLVCLRADNRAYRYRHEPREEILGVCTAPRQAGQDVPVLDNLDTIMDALQIDMANRA